MLLIMSMFYYYFTGKMLRENTVLKTLGLRHCGLGPKGLSEVCSALEVNTTLTSLDLPKNDFEEQSMAISLGKLLILIHTCTYTVVC